MNNIFLDLWGTLTYLSPGEDFILENARLLGITKEEYMIQIRNVWYLKNISAEGFAQYLLDKTQSTHSQDEILKWIMDPIARARLFPEVKFALARLKRENQLYLISDTGSVGRIIIQNLSLEDFFSGIFLSSEIGLTKRNGLYEHSFKQAKKQPSECLVVGDSLERDYKIPLSLNAKAILIDRYKKYPEYESIKSLEEIK